MINTKNPFRKKTAAEKREEDARIDERDRLLWSLIGWFILFAVVVIVLTTVATVAYDLVGRSAADLIESLMRGFWHRLAS